MRMNRALAGTLRNPPPEPIPLPRKDTGVWDVQYYYITPIKAEHERWLVGRRALALSTIHECVEINPEKLSGTPVFRGTRFSIAQFFAELADSDAVKEVATNYDLDEHVLSTFLHAFALYLNKPQI